MRHKLLRGCGLTSGNMCLATLKQKGALTIKKPLTLPVHSAAMSCAMKSRSLQPSKLQCCKAQHSLRHNSNTQLTNTVAVVTG
jgi:hypothetical protein